MNKNKILVVCLIILTSLTLCVSCKKNKTSSIDDAQKSFAGVLHAAVLNGPSGIGLVHLFENKPAIDGDFTLELCATPDVLLPKLLKGEIDIGILPPNVAAKVYNKNDGAIVIGAVTGKGMLNLITRDKSIKTVADLKGKKINCAGQGSTPEYVLRYILANNGIKEGDGTELDFSIPNPELPAALLTKKVDYAFVPEPFATVAQTKDSSIFSAFDVQSAYAQASGNTENYPMTVVVIRKEFAKQYPVTTRMFLQSCAQSIGLVNSNPAEAGALVEKHNLGLKAPIVTKMIPKSNFTYVSAEEAKPEVEKFLSLFLNIAPESIGGKLPDDDFYFK